MEKNEIKKLLYKKNPKAILSCIRKGVAYYTSIVNDETAGRILIQFEVPVSDMGDADFLAEMEAKFLIRWILVLDASVA